MSEYTYTGYSDWDMVGARRKRIADDCVRAYEQTGQEQYQKAAARIKELEAENARLEADNQRLREALTPSGETKAAYWGSDELPVMNWTDIKTIMRLIVERAALEASDGDN